MSEKTAIKEAAVMAGKPVYNIPANAIINFESGFKEKLLCDGPTFTAGSACVYNCAFCYVPQIMARALARFNIADKHEDVVIRRRNAVEVLRRQIVGKRGRKFTDPADNRVIYSSPLVDVAANMELVRETVEICKIILANTAWHIRLLSKSTLLPKIAQALTEWDIHDRGRSRVIYGVSTGTLDDKLAQSFEEGCPLVSKRIQSIHWLQDNGYRTFGMICPSLPQIGGGEGYVRFADRMAAALRINQMEHVWAEVINVRGESMTRTCDALIEHGFPMEANDLNRVSIDRNLWEKYSRETFLAHRQFIPASKLRFLQYVNASNLDWWKKYHGHGAVLLGALANTK